MYGRRFLTPTDKLLFSRRELTHIDQVRALLRATRENFSGYDFQTILVEDEEQVKVVVRRAEHRNIPQVIESVFEHRFGVGVTREGRALYVDRGDLDPTWA